MPPKLGIIADDYTGGLLVAGILESDGIVAPVVFGHPASALAGQADVIVMATRTRFMPPDEALHTIARSAEALEAAGCARIAYKACASFDSTETGNIGPAADLLADRAGNAPVLMSAGFPAHDATVHQGYLFYRGRLVSESIKRMDPLTPMSDPDLVRFLSLQTRTPVKLLAHRHLLAGEAAARAQWEALVADGVRHVLADTSDDRDAEVTARLAASGNAVLVASDPAIVSFARTLVGMTADASADRSPPPRIDGPGAVLVGSVGPTATAQIEHFAAGHPFLTLDLMDPGGEDALIEAGLAWSQAHIGDRPFGISTAREFADIAAAQAALGQVAAARKAERILAAVARGLHERGVRRLVVAGGETSGAVVDALGIRRVRALPETPLGSGFCYAEEPTPMMLFLKSGKLGADDVFARALDFMPFSDT